MILTFLNLSIFAHEIADIKLAYLQSAVSWAKNDGFKKFKILVVCFDLMIENNEKQYNFLLVFYDFEKLASYLSSMNLNFLLFAGKCRADRF